MRVYALVKSDGNVKRKAADAFLAAETRKVNEKWITKKKDCCITKAQKWHIRWQEMQQVTGEDSAEVRRFMECEEISCKNVLAVTRPLQFWVSGYCMS